MLPAGFKLTLPEGKFTFPALCCIGYYNEFPYFVIDPRSVQVQKFISPVAMQGKSWTSSSKRSHSLKQRFYLPYFPVGLLRYSVIQLIQ